MDVKSRIMRAALGLLAEGGELTQPRVSRAAGVRQSHLTYYFPTVTDLLQAVARHSFDRLAGELGAAPGRRRPPSLAAGIARATRDKRRVRMMLGLVTAADRDPSLKPRMRAFVRELRARIAPMLEAGGLKVNEDDVAFLHTVVVGAAVLQLARDNAEARREARAVLERAVKCVARH
jgi:AcrR family transcriptional regulator